jgi:Flp pilus assembly protein TadG
MMRRLRRGASAIETALLAPVALAMLGGFLEYGWYFLQEMNMNAAVREAGRIAAGTPVASDPATTFQVEIKNELADRGMGHMTQASTAWVSGDAGSRVLNIQVSVQFPGLTGLVPVPSAIKTSVTTRLEDQEPT